MHDNALAVCLAFLLLGCGPPLPPPDDGHRPPVDKSKVGLSSGTGVERFFPLVEGNVYNYRSEAADGAAGVWIVKARRKDATHGELHVPGGVKQFEYRPDGVVITSAMATPMYVLKQPFTLGNRWRGEHQGWVEITAVEVPVTVAAGRYAGCVRTVEQRGGDRPLRIDTAFCPEIGMVLLEASSGDKLERLELQSYGAPLDLGPDGVKVDRGAAAASGE